MEIYLAFKLVKTDLYMSICRYALVSYFFVLSIYFVFLGETLTLVDLPGFNFCLFIFLVNSSFCAFNLSISSLLTCVSFLIFRSLYFYRLLLLLLVQCTSILFRLIILWLCWRRRLIFLTFLCLYTNFHIF